MTDFICWLLGHALEPFDDDELTYVCIRRAHRGRVAFQIVDGIAHPIR